MPDSFGGGAAAPAAVARSAPIVVLLIRFCPAIPARRVVEHEPRGVARDDLIVMRDAEVRGRCSGMANGSAGGCSGCALEAAERISNMNVTWSLSVSPVRRASSTSLLLSTMRCISVSVIRSRKYCAALVLRADSRGSRRRLPRPSQLGNAAVHDAKGGHSDALASLKFARQLGVWFHRTYGHQPNFNPGAFVPPPEPMDATASLRDEIEALRRKVVESLDAAAAARLHAEEQAQARESLEERLRREADERATWNSSPRTVKQRGLRSPPD